LEKNALHIWPRGGYMMIALPNHDGSFTCTLFWPFEGPNSFAKLQTREEISHFFSRNFPDAVQHMPELAEEYLHNPTSSLVTVRCGPWYYRDRVVLVGDACHAVVPFFGQGANAAFEDCFVLRECLERHAPDWQAAFTEYYDTRKAHVDVLADLCVKNFVEMRDHVGSASFRFKKKSEAVLQRTFPGWFLPLYSMVAFSRIPYGDAKAKAARQKMTIKVGILGVIAAAVILGVRIWN
jgi:kynurenine 3-monooxygenase